MTIAIAAIGVAGRRRPAGNAAATRLTCRRWRRPKPSMRARAARRPPRRRSRPRPGASSSSAASRRRYPSGDVGLDDATFTVRRGEFVFLVGSTGSGKSTIMRLLIKELEPTRGHDPRRRPRPRGHHAQRRSPYYRRNLGVVFQDFKLLPNRTVHDNVAYALQVTGGTPQGDPREGARHPAPHRPVDEAAQPTPTSSPAASSSASRSRARSSTTRRCCWPTSRPATSTPRRRSGSCSCSTGSTARARRSSSPRTTTRWSTGCAAA